MAFGLTNDSQDRLRERRIAEGRCVRCGSPVEEDSDRKTCERCLERQRRATKSKRTATVLYFPAQNPAPRYRTIVVDGHEFDVIWHGGSWREVL